MPRSRRAEPSLRIVLGQLQFVRVADVLAGKPTYPIYMEDDAQPILGAGTPSKPVESRVMRPSWMVEAHYLHGKQTAAKKRIVHVSPFQAFAQLSQVFEHIDQTAAPNLALNLISRVEEEGLLGGHSSVCVAGACILAAEMALETTLLTVLGLEQLGIAPKAVCSAYLVLKGAMFQNDAVMQMVRAANGDPNRFPGRQLISSQKPGRVSVLRLMRAEMIARMGSCLQMVTNADDLPEQAADFGSPLERFDRYYAHQQCNMGFGIEEDSDDEDDAGVALPDSQHALYLSESVEPEDRHDDERRDEVTSLGVAMGNLEM